MFWSPSPSLGRNMKRLISTLLFLWQGISAGQSNLDIPISGFGFETLRRIQLRTGSHFRSQGAPVSENEINHLVSDGALRGFDSLSLQGELPSWRRNLWTWEDSVRAHSLFFSPVAELGWSSRSGNDSDQASQLTGLGWMVYGQLSPYFSYYSRGLAYTEYTDRAQFSHQYDPAFGETYSVEKRTGEGPKEDRTFNRFQHYMLLHLPWLTIKAGKDRLSTGPGYFSSLMVSRSAPDYYQIQARVDFAPWLVVDATLLQMVDTDYDILKYANLHRLQFRPSDWLSLGLQDIVIYQNRDPDWVYALPLTPMTFSEANHGGRDNAAMGMDFLITRPHGFSLWGEMFIDDLMGPTSFFDDFWENRWAVLVGFQILSPWRYIDGDLVAEWTHVEPWTYNGRMPQTSFRQYNVPSASKLGPDSRTIDIQLAYRPLAWLQIKSSGEWNEKGLSRGATLGIIHDDAIDGLTKTFLAGPTSYEAKYTLEAQMLWRQILKAKAYWQYEAEGRTTKLGVECSILW